MRVLMSLVVVAIVIFGANNTAAFSETPTPQPIECSTLEECNKEIQGLQTENKAYSQFIEEQGLTEEFKQAQLGPTPTPQSSPPGHTPGDLGGYDPINIDNVQIVVIAKMAVCAHSEDIMNSVNQQKATGISPVDESRIYAEIANMPVEIKFYETGAVYMLSYNQALEHYIIWGNNNGSAGSSANGYYTSASLEAAFKGYEGANGLTNCSVSYYVDELGQ